MRRAMVIWDISINIIVKPFRIHIMRGNLIFCICSGLYRATKMRPADMKTLPTVVSIYFWSSSGLRVWMYLTRYDKCNARESSSARNNRTIITYLSENSANSTQFKSEACVTLPIKNVQNRIIRSFQRLSNPSSSLRKSGPEISP